MYALRDAKGDTNYVKLRDVAYVFNRGPLSFDIDYQEETGIIEIWTEVPYLSKSGTEMTTPFSGNRSYTAKTVTIQYDYFWEKKLDAIVLTDDNGGGYTYFKLRDLGDLLGFKVDWSAEKGVTIDTGAADVIQSAVQVPEKAAEVVRLVNEERAKAGVAPVSTYEALDKAAQIRAAELLANYDHTRPDGRSCESVLGEVGISSNISGENIANGTMAQNPSGAMAVWMQSTGHRANILNPNFTHMGVGCVYSPDNPYRFYWVQVFTGEIDTSA